jgi:hypothetical protein
VARHRLALGVDGRVHAVDHPVVAVGLKQGVLARTRSPAKVTITSSSRNFSVS